MSRAIGMPTRSGGPGMTGFPASDRGLFPRSGVSGPMRSEFWPVNTKSRGMIVGKLGRLPE